MKQKVKKCRTGRKRTIVYIHADTCEEDDETDLKDTNNLLTVSQLSTGEVFTSCLLVGDLIWAKLSGHCNWWPSMISYDPTTAVYFQTSLNKSPKKHNIPSKYHVQFFGRKPLRGWVAKSSILEFQGLQQFLDLTCNNFTSTNQKEIWEEAVKEAEEAALLDRKERKLAYVFNYQSDNSKRVKKKVKTAKKIVPSTTNVERRKSSRLNTPFIDSNLGSHNSHISLHCQNGSNGTNHLVKCKQETESFHDHDLNSTEKPSVNDFDTVKKTPVLKDITWVENHLIGDPIYHNAENSSDSGIEDIEALESSSDDMDSLSLKRKRKPKIFEGFHIGDEINDAFKSKPKVKVDDVKGSGRDTGSTKFEKENVASNDGCKESLDTTAIKTNNGGNDLIPEAADNSMCENEPADLGNFPPHCNKRKHSDCSDVETDTSNNVIGVKSPAKKSKGDSPVSKNLKPDIYTKIDSKTFDLNSNGLGSNISSKSQKTDEGKKDKEDNVIDLTKLKRDPKDQFCSMCEGLNGDLISCSGSCLNQFHPNCLGLSFTPTDGFICDECTTNCHSCFVCQKVGETRKCSQNTCGRYYHTQCIENNQCTKFDNKGKSKFTCPHHVCRYCNENKSLKMGFGNKVMRCVRCTASYHQGYCMPAGCVVLTSNYMICDEHFEPTKNSAHIRINTTWCIICSFGGSLVCCDTCPASFHAECSDDLDCVPEGAWRCRNCRVGNKLKNGDIVWVKFSIYRWWPGKICLPEDVPTRIQNLPHSVGEFPVLFFGSRDYVWLNARRAFKYADGDTGGSKQKSYLEKYFVKALQEAKEAFHELEKKKEEHFQAFDKKQSNKPPAYKHSKVNKPVSCIRTILDRSEWPICQCNADDPCKNECLNKMLYYECSPAQCPNKGNCKNQRIQKFEYMKTKMFRCEEKGWGLKADQEIKMGDFVIEYVGELINEATCHSRIKQYHERDIYDYYFLTIDRDNIIDAYPRGNLSRFMNHSCDPNCETQKWIVNGEIRVGLYATRDIVVGEELSFNYNLDSLGNEKKKCKCGSANCSGYLGVQPKTQHSISVAEKSKNQKEKTTDKGKMKRKKTKKKVHEDECFSCGDGGELICCDREKCSKAYHQDCLIMDEAPKGKWQCPWHFCDECGKLARSMCSLCPNSFCENHFDGQMIELKDDVLVCPVHDEDEMQRLKKEKEDLKEANTLKSSPKQKEIVKAQNKNIDIVSAASVTPKKNESANKKIKKDVDSDLQGKKDANSEPSDMVNKTKTHKHTKNKLPKVSAMKSSTKKIKGTSNKKHVKCKPEVKGTTKHDSKSKGSGEKGKYLLNVTLEAEKLKSSKQKNIKAGPSKSTNVNISEVEKPVKGSKEIKVEDQPIDLTSPKKSAKLSNDTSKSSLVSKSKSKVSKESKKSAGRPPKRTKKNNLKPS